MKKFLVVCAALMLPCLLVRAQEAEDTETGVVLSVIPRLDLNPSFSTSKDGSGDFTLGNSSLYTLLEGDLTENLSFSVSNHWLSREPKYLYKNTLHSDDVNWLDWAYLNLSLGSWEFTAGKQALAMGGFEFDDYDFETHPILNSSLWQNIPSYQWGVKVGNHLTEQDLVSLQVASSPYSEHFFDQGLLNYGLEWRQERGNFESILALNYMQNQKKTGELSLKDCFYRVFTLGTRLTLGDVVLTLDLFDKVGNAELDNHGITAIPSVLWGVSDRVELLVKGGWEHTTHQLEELDRNVYNVGAAAHLYLLEDKSLRLHAVCGYNSFLDTVEMSVGVLFNLSLKVK